MEDSNVLVRLEGVKQHFMITLWMLRFGYLKSEKISIGIALKLIFG